MNAGTLRRLAKLRLAPEDMAEVLSIIADLQAVGDERKAKDRARKAASRAGAAIVHGNSEDIPETIAEKPVDKVSAPLSPKERSPTPPKEITPFTPPSKSLSSAREAEFRQELTAAFREAGSQRFPDTGMAAVWLARGFDPVLSAAVVRRMLGKNPNITLAYCEPAVAEAHAAPQARAGPGPPGPKKSASQIAAALNAKSHERTHNDPNVLDLTATPV